MGESSNRMVAAFRAAEKHGAILLFDEADSFISKRIVEVVHGADHESNSLRNTLLYCLDRHNGFVILTSNLAKSYDKAFVSRMKTFEFPMPDANALAKIWQKHINKIKAEWDEDIDIDQLAEVSFELKLSGRDVKYALLDACKHALWKKEKVTSQNLIDACNVIRNNRAGAN